MLLPVYVPTALLAIGQGLTIYTLPLYAKSLGGSLAVVGLAVAAAGIGTFAADLPAGMLLRRLGRNRLMLLGTGSAGVTALVIGLVHVMPALIAFRLLAGAGAALWSLSRMAYVTDVAPLAQRGRILSTFGGVNRAGTFAGPVIGGFVAGRFGLASPFVISGVLGLAAAVMALRVAAEHGPAPVPSSRQMRWSTVGKVLRSHGQELATAGSAQAFAQVIRAGRQLILPLYASTELGLSVEVIGIIGTVSAALDTVMFLPAGMVMDRYGRKFASVPSFVILAAGMALIPLAHNAVELTAVAVLLGFGNGIGAGTMMTLGTDLAPKEEIGEFLGLWRLIGDGGNSAGPLVVGAIAGAIGLGAAALTLAGVGGLAAMTLMLFVQETLKRSLPPPLPTAPAHASAPGCAQPKG